MRGEHKDAAYRAAPYAPRATALAPSHGRLVRHDGGCGRRRRRRRRRTADGLALLSLSRYLPRLTVSYPFRSVAIEAPLDAQYVRLHWV